MSGYTIGQAAARTGISASALRYYEKHGLIEPVGRTGAGYRLYDDGTLERLAFITRAKGVGCTLEEIADLVQLWTSQECGPVQRRLHQLVTAKISETRRRTSELIGLTGQLQAAGARLGQDPGAGPCDPQCACSLMGDAMVSPGGSIAATDDDPGLLCTLPPSEVPVRIGEWAAILGHVRSREPLGPNGMRFLLDTTAPLGEVVRLAVAEQECCPFFEFTLTVDARGVALEVKAPAAAADVVSAVFAAVT